MGEFTTLMARDGHEFQAYLAAPAGKAHGAIVVIQEIFGVNSHIRSGRRQLRGGGLHRHRPCAVRSHPARGFSSAIRRQSGMKAWATSNS